MLSYKMDILGFGVLQFFAGKLYHDDKFEVWNITINHDSNVVSFNIDENFTLDDAQAVLAIINHKE